MQVLPLEDLSSFRHPGENWAIAGAVRANPEVRRDLSSEPGTGVLVNLPTDEAAENLFTDWEHDDLAIDLEVLMPKGSNSGVYLQGRYEIQLLDSWGVENPRHGDIGGIYQRWDPDRPEDERGYEGHPPRVNAARAPGEWQHLEIDFRAPRFDDDGRKISNGRFLRVVLNGELLHEDVEVKGPTRAAAFDDEQPTGPLMLQGDHGPVAFRNIRFRH